MKPSPATYLSPSHCSPPPAGPRPRHHLHLSGRLDASGTLASSLRPQFALYTANLGGSQVSPSLTNAAVSLTDGLFTVNLNFGANIFTGSNYWLDITVHTNGSSAFTP